MIKQLFWGWKQRPESSQNQDGKLWLNSVAGAEQSVMNVCEVTDSLHIYASFSHFMYIANICIKYEISLIL